MFVAGFRAFVAKDPVLIALLAAGAFIWAVVFLQACGNFGGIRPLRAVWSGSGILNFAGMTVPYCLEGWADYDYYYVTWADQFLIGKFPYTDEFNLALIDGSEYRTPYFFPPMFLYLCVIGRVLPLQPYGIGLLITLFGFLTAFPIYRITNYLSGSRLAADLAVLTYLFNPLVLYHTVFEWLNPSPFVFFAMMSFSLMMGGHRSLGTLSMVTAALFKQTAFFLLLPVLAYILKKPPAPHSNGPSAKQDSKTLPSDKLDPKAFLKDGILAGVYIAAVSLPYLVNPWNYVYSVLLKIGGMNIQDFSGPPAGNMPITFTVVFIVAGAPEWLCWLVNFICFYSIGLLAGVLLPLVKMLLEVKDDSNLRVYWRRMLYYTLIMIICVHLFSPRGVYKYYFVALMPLLSILAVGAMFSRSGEDVKPSAGMILWPFVWSLLILMPDRNVYLVFVALMLAVYVAGPKMSPLVPKWRMGERTLSGRSDDTGPRIQEANLPEDPRRSVLQVPSVSSRFSS